MKALGRMLCVVLAAEVEQVERSVRSFVVITSGWTVGAVDGVSLSPPGEAGRIWRWVGASVIFA